MSHIEPFYVSINEAARLLGVSRSSVYRLINAKILPAIKLGGRTLIEVTRLRGLNGTEA